MNPAITLSPTSAGGTLRRAYRRLMSVPARTRWLAGLLAPLLVMAACLGLGAILPETSFRPLPVLGLLTWVLVSSIITDLLWRRIFNFVLISALGWVALLQVLSVAGFTTGLPSAAESATGFVVCFGMMLLLYLTFRGGEGDVKLVAVLGAMLGWWHGMEAAVMGYLLAAVVAALLVVARIAHRAFGQTDSRIAVFAGTLPMAPFFGIGVLASLC